MFFKGKIASPEHNAGTVVAMVMQQLQKTRTIHCGKDKGQMHILGLPKDKDGQQKLKHLMHTMHRVTSAGHKFIDAVIDPQLFGNSLECFDVVQWVEILQTKDSEEPFDTVGGLRSTKAETIRRLQGCYVRYCAGRGWEPAINSFKDLMLEAARVHT